MNSLDSVSLKESALHRAPPNPAKAARIPGEAGFWILISGELFAFSTFFLIFSYYHAQAPEMFSSGRESLSQTIGLINTLFLLTSSLFVAMGVRRVREKRNGAVFLFRLALGLGLSFAALKVFEYNEKLSAGITPLTNDFYMYYYAFTGIHLTHVLIGSVGLLVLAHQAGNRPPSKMRTMIAECGATFWHLVDLLWIVLFALFYLAGSGHGQG